jgi:hypothetical protein
MCSTATSVPCNEMLGRDARIFMNLGGTHKPIAECSNCLRGIR